MPGVPAVAYPSAAGLHTFPQTLIASSAVPPNWRAGIISWAEMEVPNAARRGSVSWAELETPTAARRGQLSWAEMQVPNAARRGLVAWAELEVPDAVVVVTGADGRVTVVATLDRVARHA
jgi:hypothetical protein